MTSPQVAFERFADVLSREQHADGGLGWTAGATAEPEPTALLALALDDDRARRWLLEHQGPDGAVVLETGEVRNTGAAALTALALPTEQARLDALAFAVGAVGSRLDTPDAADDPLGWPWVPGTYAWVEPTARVLLATRALRPSDDATTSDALTILRDREVDGGGWNYGNSSVRGTDLTPYAQTTAMACIALHGMDEPCLERGLEALRRLLRVETGGLSLAMGAEALRLDGRDEESYGETVAALASQYERTGFLGNLGTLAWAALATRDGRSPLEVDG